MNNSSPFVTKGSVLCSYVLGALIPFAGLFDSLTLIAPAALLACIRLPKSKIIKTITPIILLLLIWALISLTFSSSSSLLMIPALIFIYVLFFEELSSKSRSRNAFHLALVIAVPISLALTLFQKLTNESLPFANLNAYWITQERLAGTLSDPNAFGSFAFLAFVYFYHLFNYAKDNKRKGGLLLVLFGLALLPLYTGSRSFVVCMTFFVSFHIYRWKRYLIVIPVTIILIAVFVANGLVSQNIFEYLPTTGVRILQSLNAGTVYESLSSRIIFTQIALTIVSEYPLLGTGPGSFISLAPAFADFADVYTDIWTDNANNFFLHVLCEIGIVGFLFMFLSFSGLKSKGSTQNGIILSGIVIFIFSLLLGPHLFFTEVTLLFLFLCSFVFETQARNNLLSVLPIFIPVALYLPFYSTSLEHGWHNWELDGDTYYRWTQGKSAFSFINCKHDKASIYVRSHVAGTEVAISSGQQRKTLSLTPGEKGNVSFDCRGAPHIRFALKTNRSWVPQESLPHSRDNRTLGIQVFWGRPSFSLPFRRNF